MGINDGILYADEDNGECRDIPAPGPNFDIHDRAWATGDYVIQQPPPPTFEVNIGNLVLAWTLPRTWRNRLVWRVISWLTGWQVDWL